MPKRTTSFPTSAANIRARRTTTTGTGVISPARPATSESGSLDCHLPSEALPHAKGAGFYTNFDAAAHTSFALMQHNGAHGDPDGTALHQWLNAVYLPHESPKPPPFDLPPPKRADFALGNDGREQYHIERAQWYRRVTVCAEHPEGLTLEGSLAAQNDLFDKIARRYRSYTDSRPSRGRGGFGFEE